MRALPQLENGALRIPLLAANAAGVCVMLGTMFAPGWHSLWVLPVHAWLVFAMLAPNCTWLGRVANRFRPTGREVWLTVDDGPDGENHAELAAQLALRGVRATFFAVGKKLAAHRHHAHRACELGHTFSNHTWSHPVHWFWCLTPWQLAAEIDRAAAELDSISTPTGRIFRAPFGVKHVLLQPLLARRQMQLLGWTVRGRDGIRCEPSVVVERVLRKVTPGSILLLHEGRPQSNGIILAVVDALLAEGYRFVIPSMDRIE